MKIDSSYQRPPEGLITSKFLTYLTQWLTGARLHRGTTRVLTLG